MSALARRARHGGGLTLVLLLTSLMLLASDVVREGRAATTTPCDVNGDGMIDQVDIDLIVAAQGTKTTASDPRDANGDGKITPADAQQCRALCTMPRCEVAPKPSVVALEPKQLVVPVGQTATLVLRVQNPSRGTGVRVSLSSANPAVASVPSQVVVPVGSSSANVTVRGVSAGGPVTITALLNNSASTAAVTVSGGVPPPAITEPLVDGATVVGGTGLAGAVVAVQVNAAPAGSGPVAADGTFQVTVPVLRGGDVVRASQTLSGVTSGLSTPVTVHAIPPAPTLTPPLVEGATSVRGSGASGASVTVYLDGVAAGTGVAGGNGAFAVTVTPLVAGQQATATQTVDGVQSIPSAPLTVVAIPPPPTITTPLVAGSVTVGGSATSGALVEVVIDGTSVGTTTATEAGIWSLPVQPLSAGRLVKARQTVAGVASAFSAEITVVAPPPAPVLHLPLVATATHVSGTGIAGAVVTVFVNGSSVGSTTVAIEGTWSVLLSVALSTGQIVDAAQAVAGVSSVRSDPATVVAPPPAPTLTGPIVAGSTSVSGLGTGGASVTVFVDTVAVGNVAVAVGGAWTLNLAFGLEAGEVVQASQTFGEVIGPLSEAVTVLAPPPPPVVNPGLVAGDTTITGTGVAGASLDVLINAQAVGTTSVNQDLTWSFPVSPLTAGQVVTATQTVAGLVSAPSLPVTVGQAVLVQLEILPAPTASVARGQTLAFTARGTFSDHSVVEPLSGVQWTSDTPTVASISIGGVATGVAEGTAGIRGTRSGVQSALTVLTVGPAVVVSLAIDPPSPSTTVGQDVQLHAVATMSDGSSRDVTTQSTWTTSDPSRVTVGSGTGLAHGVAAGSATITATHSSGPAANVLVTVTLSGCQAPTITNVTPLTGPVGTEVTITGTNFDCGDRRTLTLNGVPLVITSLSPTQIKTFIPVTGQDGLFALATDGGTVAAAPQLAYDVVLSSDFVLTASPAESRVIQGGSASYVVQIASAGGQPFTGLASLEILGLPTGVTASLSPSVLTGGGRAILTLSAASTVAPGTLPLTVRATATTDAQTVVKTAPFELTVLPGNRSALLGQFTLKDGTPMPGVVLSLVNKTDGSLLAQTATDAAGSFLVLDPPAGTHTLSVDTTRFDLSRAFPIYGLDVTVVAGTATVLQPFRITPPPPPQAFVPIANASADQVVTNPDVPGVSITLPRGATITGWDGLLKNKITIIKLAPDDLPMPPPPGLARSFYQFNFGTNMGGLPSVPLPVTLPNDQNAEPGEKVEIWFYDAAPFVGVPAAWKKAGLGTVSQDGSVIVSDPGVGIDRFCGVCGTSCMIRQQEGQPNHNADSPKSGDPVDLFLGQQVERVLDLALPGRIPALVHRTYNPVDPFAIKGMQLGLGIGWALSVDIVLLQASTTLQRLVLPGNTRFDFTQQSVGTFVNTTHGRFAGAVLTAETGNAFRLRFKDGSSWRFLPHPNPQLVGTSLLAQQADRNGNVLTVQRDATGNITQLVEPAGRALTFSYSGGRIVQITDPLGRTVRYTYSGARLLTVTNPAGGVTTYGYDGAGRILTIRNPRNITYLTNEYNAEGRVSRQTFADGGVWTFEYLRPPGTTTGAITGARITDPRGTSTTYRVSSTGFTTDAVDALGQRTTYSLDSRGQVVAITDALGRVASAQYDGAGNVTRVIDTAGNATVLEYEPTFSKLTKITDPLGHATALAYDAQGNLVQVTDPLGHATRVTYDATGLPVSTVDRLGQTATYTYDAAGNLATITDPAGNVTQRTYDAVSRLILQVDPRGRKMGFGYDVLDRLAQISDAASGLTTLGYDANGNVLTVTDARGHAISHAYDAMDRLTTRTDALGRSEAFEHDLNGNLVRITDRKGQVTTLQYDVLNRRTGASYADGAVTLAEFDAVGRRVRAKDSTAGEILFSYDALDRLVATTAELGSVRYGYDPIGRRTSMSVSGQTPVSYGYDANGRLVQVTRGAQIVSLGYDALDRRTRLTLPNGVSTEYVYDPASRITELIYRNATGTLGNLTYQYDPRGQRRAIGGSLAQVLLPDAVPSATYDAGNRQLQFGDQAMSYDLAGNLSTITSPAGVTTLTWDARHRLTGLSGPGTSAAFAYDAVGRRATRQVNGAIARYLHDGFSPVLAVEDGASRTLLSGLEIDEPWTRSDDEFYLADVLGTIVGVTDASGTIGTRYAYEPFGRPTRTGASTNGFQFTARENDGTGLHYYRARYYSPSLHRFISEDPMGLAAGDPNYYAYVGNNPLLDTDPFGLDSGACEGTYESPPEDARPTRLKEIFRGAGRYAEGTVHVVMSLVFSSSRSAVLGVEWGIGFPKFWKAGTKLADIGIKVLHRSYVVKPAEGAVEAIEELSTEVLEHGPLHMLDDWLKEQTKKAERRAVVSFCRGNQWFSPPQWPAGLE